MSRITISRTYIDQRTLCDDIIKTLPVNINGADFFPNLDIDYDTIDSTVWLMALGLEHDDRRGLYIGRPGLSFENMRKVWNYHLQSAGVSFSATLKVPLTLKNMMQLYDPLLLLAEHDAILQSAGQKLLDTIRSTQRNL